MKKLTLCIEELRVDSFGTPAPSGERGTVRAYDSMDDSIGSYEPFPTGDEDSCSYHVEAGIDTENQKAQAQRHQIRMETDNKVR